MGKKNKKQTIDSGTNSSTYKSVLTANNQNKTPELGLFLFIKNNKDNKLYLLSGILIGILFFTLLRYFFPEPSFYSDSYTYIGAAKDNKLASYRPIEYSAVIQYFHNFTNSDFALIFVQYFTNVFANIFLFFTFCYFFPINKWLKLALFLVLTINPLYIICSNYVLSDALFCSITVIWFTTLIYTIRRPHLWQFAVQVILLLLLFKLRYNAIIFPVLIALAVLLSNQKLWMKLTWIFTSVILIVMLMKNTADTNEEATTVHTFSSFSGWQMANDALHMMPYTKNTDTTAFDDDSKEAYAFIKNYFDTVQSKNTIAPTSGVTPFFMWDKRSPLKKYVPLYATKYGFKDYFLAWCSLGPIYYKMGQTLILQHPMLYYKHFIYPNTGAYFIPDLEAYGSYNENRDSVATIAKDYYQYKTTAIDKSSNKLHDTLIKPWPILFFILNTILLVSSVLYFGLGIFRTNNKVFNQSILMFLALYFINFFFVVCLAPSVFRYHLFIVTLSWGYIALISQQIVVHFKR